MNSSDEAVEAKFVRREILHQLVKNTGYGAANQLLDDLIAAVRAEAVADPDAQPCTSCEGPTGNPDTFCDACKLDELEQECDRLRAKLAEAVADERRRIIEQVRAAKDEQVRAFGRDPGAYFAGRVDGMEDASRVVAAGSVPVATPPAEPAATVHDANCEQQLGACCCHCQKRADVAFSHAAPSQPVTCPHEKTEGHVIDLARPHMAHCPGPVSVPKESSE